MDRQPVLEGERLQLRPLRPEDWSALWAIASDRDLWAAHPSHDRWQEPVFREFFADALAKGGALAIVDKASGEIVGSSRFQDYDPADGGSVEIGWTFLARRLWGSGLNAELKRLMLSHAFRFVERVNFKVGDELGGHIVTGHVDAVGLIDDWEPKGASTRLSIHAPKELARFIAPKGSIAVDGVSLTVNEVEDRPDGSVCFGVNVIPHTSEMTTLGEIEQGAQVNLEIDTVARYLQRLESLKA